MERDGGARWPGWYQTRGTTWMCVRQAFAKISKAPSSKPCRAHFRHTLESLEGPVPEDAPAWRTVSYL